MTGLIVVEGGYDVRVVVVVRGVRIPAWNTYPQGSADQFARAIASSLER